MLKKAIYFPFLIGMAQLPIVTHAQLNKEKGETHIVVNSKTIRVATLLGILSKETDLEFSFNSKKLSPSREITVTRHDQTLAAWLKELEKTTGIHVRVKGDHIILQDAPVPVQTAGVREAAMVKSERRPVAVATHLSGKEKAAATSQKTKANASARVQKQLPEQEERVNSNVFIDASTTHENSLAADTREMIISNNNITYPVSNAMSDVHASILYDEELRLLPAYEMHAPDKQLSNASRMAVTDAKEMTAVTKEHAEADSTPAPALPLRKLTSLELGLQGIGLAFELPVAQQITVKFSAGLGGGYDLRNDFSYEWGLADPCVYLSVNPRYYYNRNKRVKKGKNNSLNAGNYIGLRIKYTSTSISEADMTDAIVSNIHWGMQTPIGRKWVIDGHAGIGWGFNFIDDLNVIHSRFYPAVEIRFSYILNKKRNL